MRIVGGILLIASTLICLVLGALQVMSSRYQQMRAEDNAGDLSSVSRDLDVSEVELSNMHQAAQAKVGTVGQRELLIGIALFTSSALQALGCILLLLRRARRVMLTVIAISGLALGSAIIAQKPGPLGLIAAGLVLVALVLAALGRPRPQVPTT
jgi:hypothetical protein